MAFTLLLSIMEAYHKVLFALIFIGLSCSKQTDNEQRTSQNIKENEVHTSTESELVTNENKKHLDSTSKLIPKLEAPPSIQDSTFSIIDYELTNEEYLATLFDYKLIPKLKSQNINFRIKTSSNPHVKGQIDTTFYFSTDDSNIEVYKTPTREIVCSIDLKEDIIDINEVYIGMTKTEFGRLFQLPDSIIDETKTYRIKDIQWGEFMDFDFTTDTLKHLRFKGYFD